MPNGSMSAQKKKRGEIMHYFNKNIADYRKDTAHLKPMEHYIYNWLIDSYYLNESPIPNKTKSVLRRLSLESEYLKDLENVLNDFFVLKGSSWHHTRIDREIEVYHSKCKTNSINGKKGGRPKKQQLSSDKNPKKTQSVKSDNPNKSELKPNQEPITKNHKPITNKKNRREPPDFSKVKNLNMPAWQKWVNYRKNVLGSKPYKTDLKAQRLAKFSYDIQAKAVATAMEKEWSDVYPDKIGANKRAKAVRTMTDSELTALCAELKINMGNKTYDQLYAEIDEKQNGV